MDFKEAEKSKEKRLNGEIVRMIENVYGTRKLTEDQHKQKSLPKRSKPSQSMKLEDQAHDKDSASRKVKDYRQPPACLRI